MPEIPDYTGANIRACRRYRDMSRAQLLSELKDYGISLHQSSLKRMEDGEQPVKVHEALALSQIFDLELYDLVAKPLDGDEGMLAAAVSKYKSVVSRLTFANWQAIEARDELEKAVKDFHGFSSARRDAEYILSSDEPLFNAMLNLSTVFTELVVTEKDRGNESR